MAVSTMLAVARFLSFLWFSDEAGQSNYVKEDNQSVMLYNGDAIPHLPYARCRTCNPGPPDIRD